ncbi:hypothetical protein Syun_028012 [Stephania yunnanensis]|uniref:Uncharacterized protein n=1 Tax=Stephania yunnanensis TaxID=152371 RepID=A0AAP0EGK9_9MAGN
MEAKNNFNLNNNNNDNRELTFRQANQNVIVYKPIFITYPEGFPKFEIRSEVISSQPNFYGKNNEDPQNL